MDQTKEATAKTKNLSAARVRFPIVAIGASAGGLEAVGELLRHLPADTGMAFFYVQHLSPNHSSVLATLLAKDTKMTVSEVKNDMPILPNNVYVCTPNKEMVPRGNKIKLQARDNAELPYLPIDDFFIVVAKEYGNNTIGILLSGKATDGTLGLKAIKDAKGKTFVQDASAKYGSMPSSAVRAGAVDYILSPAQMARELSDPGKNGHIRQQVKEQAAPSTIEESAIGIKAILNYLHEHVGMDFSHYKSNTIGRRINHRMQQCGIAVYKEYLELLHNKEEEAAALYKDLFIHVTSFFREKEIFKFLKSSLLPRLLKSKVADEHQDELRIWVPACSTGEEAYSLAMLICELQDDVKYRVPVKIFATDISEQAINIARVGEYSAQGIKNIPPRQTARFFTKSGKFYRVKKEIRDMCLFASHNILSDPPFSRIDFISCCNLLIYLDKSAQTKALTTFCFALRDTGYLMLGKSETTSALAKNFVQINNKYKLYLRSKHIDRKLPALIPGVIRKEPAAKAVRAPMKQDPLQPVTDVDAAVDAILLTHFMPASAVVNKDMDILSFRGSTDFFLRHQSGKATLNILKMTRPEMVYDLRVAINNAIKTKRPVKRKAIEIKTDGDAQLATLDIIPLPAKADDQQLLVVFNKTELPTQEAEVIDSSADAVKHRVQRLKEEIVIIRQEMSELIETHEATNEALQIANEEIVSSNEEFQTLNEELETSKEEIEAANEELISTNQELQMRNELLAESYNYSEAIIATIHEPMLVLNKDLTVKSANLSFYKKFKSRREDTETKSLFAINNGQWNIPQLRARMEEIITKNIGFHGFEVTHTFRDVGEKVMLLNAHQIEQKGGQEQLILFAIEDITELSRQQQSEKQSLRNDIHLTRGQNEQLEKAVQKRTRELENANKQLAKKNAELIKANNDLTAFTYISTHDLQEPLRKIQLLSSCILNEKEQKLSERATEYFHRMQDTAKRMQQLLEDLSSYSLAKDVSQPFLMTDLNKILAKVKSELSPLFHHKEATIISDNLCTICVIPAQISLLFRNIIENALKFSHPLRPQQISISCTIADGDEIDAHGIQPEKQYCHIGFHDKGIGFDAEYSDQIFEVFKRLHTSDEYEGTGVGLAICRRIVDNHGGVITATSKLNEGACFDLYLPTTANIPVKEA